MKACDLFDRLRYQVYRPAVTTMGPCSNGCGESARGSGECWKCLANQIDILVTTDTEPALAYRTAMDALEASRAMHRLGEDCYEFDKRNG